MTPARLGHYEIVSLLGRGGMGVVYRARSPEGRDVAVKLLAHADGDARARFEREMRLLGGLGEAEGFVPLLDAGVAREGPFFVMPLLGGGTLRDRLRRGPLGIDETVRLVTALARALGEAHARGIVHRDLKPENVLFQESDRPLVADLGLAKHFDGSASGASKSVALSSSTAGLRGTIGYMAPEQQEDARRVGPPADVFALGAIAYECLAGKPAFEGEALLDLLQRVASGDRLSLREACPKAPAELAEVIERALARDPARRYPDGLAFARALSPGKTRSARRPLLLGTLLLIGGAAVAVRVTRPKEIAKPSPAPVTTTTRALTADQLVRRANARARAGDLDGGIQDCTAALAVDPRFAPAWGERGAAKCAKGDLQGALEDLTRGLELEPGWALALTNRGFTRLLLHDDAGALADFKRALVFEPGTPDIWLRCARIHDARHEVGEVISCTTSALRYDSKLVEAWARRAAANLAGGDFVSARRDATATLELDPRNADAHGIRGRAEVELGEIDAAIADLERFLELAPNHAQAPTVRAAVEDLRRKR